MGRNAVCERRRDDIRCLHCGRALEANPRGRPRRYCSDRCRKAANRARRSASAETIWWSGPGVELHLGDARGVLDALPAASVQALVTSVPYWRLRDYPGEDAIGMEDTVEDYLGALVVVMRAARKALRADGTAWVNIADVSSMRAQGERRAPGRAHTQGRIPARPSTTRLARAKSLLCLPQRLELALIDEGWILRSEITWHKPNATPETVTDRPRRTHEKVLMLTKSPTYRCRRADADVWKLPTVKTPVGHAAAFPASLAACCLEGCVEDGDLVCDPFCGSGSTGVAAWERGCRFVGIDTDVQALEGARTRLTVPVL
jgi:site-specific DNA-methyltransferase (adenine-specific)